MIEKIVDLARKRGLTQGQLEAAAHLPQGRISKWKNRDGEPSVSQGLKLARLLGSSLDYLADEETSSPPAPALSADEERILWLVRAAGLSADDVAKAITRYTAAVADAAGMTSSTDRIPGDAERARQPKRA